MSDIRQPSRTVRCVVCGGTLFDTLATRADGMPIIRCSTCGMGVVEIVPADLSVLYDDEYYGTAPRAETQEQGYSDYSYTAEHSVSWAAALVPLLCPQGGRVLDIGCADGHLLTKLGPRYHRFGIEANEAIGRIAEQADVVLLGRDLLAPDIAARYAGFFDVVTAIAVFEHLRDIRLGVSTALALLRPGGALVFEVPLMSASADNSIWLTSSLEHVWYPSERAIRRLIETELGATLVGSELSISGYGSTYIGVVFPAHAIETTGRPAIERVLSFEKEPLTDEEARARMFLELVHAAQPTMANLEAFGNLAAEALNPNMLRRLAELWKADIWRRNLAEADAHRGRAETAVAADSVIQLEAALVAARVEAERLLGVIEQERSFLRRVQSDLEVTVQDRAISHGEMTSLLVALQARLTAVEARLAAKSEANLVLGREKSDLALTVAELRTAAASEAAAAARARVALQTAVGETAAVRVELDLLHASRIWPLVTRLRVAASRYPRASRFIFRAARVAWWIARGRLVSRLRRRRQAGRPVQLATIADLPSLLPPPAKPIPSTTASAPERTTPIACRVPVVLDVTGHRPVPQRSVDGADAPVVSIVIVSFNYGRMILDAVDSALRQTYRNLEVIVVEGGSNDQDSRFVVADLQRPRTRVLMQGPGHSAGANRNYGISQARGRYVCCLDADDILAPTYIEKAIYMLERHGYDAVSCGMQTFGDDHKIITIMEHPDLAALLDGNNVMICALFRRTLWERAGGFRDVDRNSVGYVYEDWAFWLRLAALGARFYNLFHDPMLLYRIHGPSLSRATNVLPMWKQRQMVRLINEDVLQNLPELIARSRQKALIRSGTSMEPRRVIDIDGPALAVRHRPSLLLAMPFLILGGAERLLSGLVGHLVRQGWRIVIVTSISTGPEHGDTTAWFEQHTTEIFHLHLGLRPDIWADFIEHLVESRSIDIVWIVGSAAAYDTLRRLRASCPHLRVADLLFNVIGHTANNRRRRDLIDLIFVENDEVRDWLLRRNEDPARIALVESGVDLVELQPMPPSPAFLEGIGALPGDLVIGFSGRWSEEKNPLGFVEIARRIDERLPARFVMTGTGHMRGAVEQAVRDANFREGRFHLLGPVPDIKPVLGSFDLLVLPSILDGRPVIVLEALAMGVPVLASRVGGLPSLVQDGETGWLCDPTDIGAFAARIERAAQDRAGLRAMRHSARRFAENNLDVAAMQAAYERKLASLLPTGAIDV